MAHGCLYAILGLPTHASPIAVYRELGWLGLTECAATAKLSIYKSILDMPKPHPARQLLVARIGEYNSPLAGAVTLPLRAKHAGITAPVKKSSYFVRDVINIIHTATSEDTAKTQMDTPTNKPRKLFAEMKTIHVPARCKAYYRDLFQRKRSSANYFPALKWEMMPDLLAYCNQDMCTDYTTLSLWRTHGHALGDSISKYCRPRGTEERCPCCNQPERENITHALLQCPHTARTTSEHLPILRNQMVAIAPAWGRSFDRQTSDASKARLIVMASCVPTKSSDKKEVCASVKAWFEAIRERHPLFSKFKDSRGIYKLGYY